MAWTTHRPGAQQQHPPSVFSFYGPGRLQHDQFFDRCHNRSSMHERAAWSLYPRFQLSFSCANRAEFSRLIAVHGTRCSLTPRQLVSGLQRKYLDSPVSLVGLNFFFLNFVRNHSLVYRYRSQRIESSHLGSCRHNVDDPF